MHMAIFGELPQKVMSLVKLSQKENTPTLAMNFFILLDSLCQVSTLSYFKEMVSNGLA